MSGAHIAGGEQFLFTRLQPAQTRVRHGIADNAGYDTSCRRWPLYVRSRNSDRDDRRVRRCGSV